MIKTDQVVDRGLDRFFIWGLTAILPEEYNKSLDLLYKSWYYL